MRRIILSASAAALMLSACGNTSTPSEKAAPEMRRTTEIQSPVQIDYSVIGTPIVGQVVAVDLKLRSSLGAEPYKISFRVNDPTAMQFPESQSASISISPSADEFTSQQVRVIPLREGRLYLNVAAVFESDSGSMQTVTAIPIQVGPEAARQTLENGTVTTDENGNLIRSLPADEE